jgi:hypothetical protein
MSFSEAMSNVSKRNSAASLRNDARVKDLNKKSFIKNVDLAEEKIAREELLLIIGRAKSPLVKKKLNDVVDDLQKIINKRK